MRSFAVALLAVTTWAGQGCRYDQREGQKINNFGQSQFERSSGPKSSEVHLTDRQVLLRQLAMEITKSRERALTEARLCLLQEIEEARSRLPNDPENTTRLVLKPETVDAIQLCQLLRDLDSIAALIDLIDFVAPVYEMDLPRRDLYFLSNDHPPLHKLFPARSALVAIGTPCVRPLVEAIKGEHSRGKDWGRIYALRSTLAAIAGPEGGLRALREAIDKSAFDVEKTRLQQAIEEFRTEGAIGLLTERAEFQLYQGTVFEDLSPTRTHP